MLTKEFQVGIHTGGTFTDGVSLARDGTLITAKSLATPPDPSVGVINVLQSLAERENGISLQEFLGKTENIVLGTNAAINTILTLTGAKVAMINTQGFVDILEQRRLTKANLFDWKLPKPVILIPRYMRFEVEERVKYTGEVITPLNEDSARDVVRKAKANKAEVIAVCLLHSYIQPKHEQRLAEIIREEYPEARVVLSSDIWPHIVEFSRCSTAAVTAYVTPTIIDLLNSLQRSLAEKGFKGALLVMSQNGGVVTTEEAINHSWTVVCGGQAGSPLSAISLAELDDVQDIVLIDMGGTSVNLSVLPKRTVTVSTDNRIGDQLFAPEVVSVDQVIPGGGSIAWLDQRGFLCIGPDSAGAEPGPACYGKRGDKPTITDADVVLGYIPTDYFLGGEITLDVNLARRAIEKEIAEPLGIDTIEAAYMIRRLADSYIADQISLSVVDRGYDLGNFALYIAGGAGPTHAFDLAKNLNFRQFYIPKIAPVFGAFGMLNADVRHDFTQVLYQSETELDLDQVGKAYDKMESEGVKKLESEGIPLEKVSIIRGAYMRYYGQASELRISLPEVPPGLQFTRESLQDLIETFHHSHHEMRGYSDTNAVTFIHTLQLTVVGKRMKMNLPQTAGDNQGVSEALKYHREVFFKELGGLVKVPCYDGDRLQRGNIIPGPAVIEERATTIVIPPEADLRLDKYGNYVGKVSRTR